MEEKTAAMGGMNSIATSSAITCRPLGWRKCVIKFPTVLKERMRIIAR